MSEKLGQETAYPIVCDGIRQEGVSKRFYAACAAMQGLLSSTQVMERAYEEELHGGLSIEESVCRAAYGIADELLKQEDE